MGNLFSLSPKEIPEVVKVKKYCTELLWIRFCGQTSGVSVDSKQDESVFEASSVNNLGHKLKAFDALLRKKEPKDFDDENEEIVSALREIAVDRRNANINETEEQCFQRLKGDCKRFAEIYKERNKHSQPVGEKHVLYWGTRQQMLFGKVVADWISTSSKKGSLNDSKQTDGLKKTDKKPENSLENTYVIIDGLLKPDNINGSPKTNSSSKMEDLIDAAVKTENLTEAAIKTENLTEAAVETEDFRMDDIIVAVMMDSTEATVNNTQINSLEKNEIINASMKATHLSNVSTTKDPMNESATMDPVFGLLLNPTGGRAGRGDSGWFHNLLYDDIGKFAFHSAVHDAFGYLKTAHHTGPGYDYLEGEILSDDNPVAGQVSGLTFWSRALDEQKTVKKIYVYI